MSLLHEAERHVAAIIDGNTNAGTAREWLQANAVSIAVVAIGSIHCLQDSLRVEREHVEAWQQGAKELEATIAELRSELATLRAMGREGGGT